MAPPGGRAACVSNVLEKPSAFGLEGAFTAVARVRAAGEE